MKTFSLMIRHEDSLIEIIIFNNHFSIFLPVNLLINADVSIIAVV